MSNLVVNLGLANMVSKEACSTWAEVVLRIQTSLANVVDNPVVFESFLYDPEIDCRSCSGWVPMQGLPRSKRNRGGARGICGIQSASVNMCRVQILFQISLRSAS